jgi:hypothetical protein
MGRLLLHDPLIQCYLVFVAALFAAFLADYYLRTWPKRPRPPRKEVATRALVLFRSVTRKTLGRYARPVKKGGLP